MENKKFQTLSDVIGEKNHSEMLLDGLGVINASQGFLRQGWEITARFREEVGKMPDFSGVPLEELTPQQIQELTDRANLLAHADNVLSEINAS